ncbi:MAG: FAD-dependent oxidoreductase, partial [Planctomycetota bacterium]
IAISFGSNKFAGRAPEDHVLLRVFLGGAKRRDLLEQSESWILNRAVQETAELLSINGEPAMQRLYRWSHVTPQYHVGHDERLDRIEKLVASTQGLALAGNAFRGIGIPQCIRSGYQAVERIMGSSAER